MKQYMLSIYQPDGVTPPPELLEPVMKNMHALVQEAKDAGVWIFNGGLHPPAASTVVRISNGAPLVTDGPFIEGKEHIGGFLIITAPDLDAALAWARKTAEALRLPGQSDSLAIEVRPFQH
ncbi:MAG TPA: YciI family protein [Vicinamibacterales bacterium]